MPPSAKEGTGAWGFRGQEGDPQDAKKSRCLPCIQIGLLYKRLSLVIALYLNFFRQLKERSTFFLSLLHCLQFKVIHRPKRHLLWSRILLPSSRCVPTSLSSFLISWTFPSFLLLSVVLCH